MLEVVGCVADRDWCFPAVWVVLEMYGRAMQAVILHCGNHSEL